MYEDKTLKDIVKEELTKLKALSWSERLVYIWDYYKPLMAIIIGIGVMISMGITIYHNKTMNTILQSYWINGNAYDIDSNEIARQFGEYLGGIGPKDVIVIDAMNSFGTGNDDQYSMASQMKITAVTAAGEADVLVMDEALFEHYMSAGGLDLLEDYYTEEQMAGMEPYLVESTSTEGVTGYYAVDISDSKILKDNNAYPLSKAYALVAPNSHRKDAGAAFIRFLLGI